MEFIISIYLFFYRALSWSSNWCFIFVGSWLYTLFDRFLFGWFDWRNRLQIDWFLGLFLYFWLLLKKVVLVVSDFFHIYFVGRYVIFNIILYCQNQTLLIFLIYNMTLILACQQFICFTIHRNINLRPLNRLVCFFERFLLYCIRNIHQFYFLWLFTIRLASYRYTFLFYW